MDPNAPNNGKSSLAQSDLNEEGEFGSVELIQRLQALKLKEKQVEGEPTPFDFYCDSESNDYYSDQDEYYYDDEGYDIDSSYTSSYSIFLPILTVILVFTMCDEAEKHYKDLCDAVDYHISLPSGDIEIENPEIPVIDNNIITLNGDLCDIDQRDKVLKQTYQLTGAPKIVLSFGDWQSQLLGTISFVNGIKYRKEHKFEEQALFESQLNDYKKSIKKSLDFILIQLFGNYEGNISLIIADYTANVNDIKKKYQIKTMEDQCEIIENHLKKQNFSARAIESFILSRKYPR